MVSKMYLKNTKNNKHTNHDIINKNGGFIYNLLNIKYNFKH